MSTSFKTEVATSFKMVVAKSRPARLPQPTSVQPDTCPHRSPSWGLYISQRGVRLGGACVLGLPCPPRYGGFVGVCLAPLRWWLLPRLQWAYSPVPTLECSCLCVLSTSWLMIYASLRTHDGARFTECHRPAKAG